MPSLDVENLLKNEMGLKITGFNEFGTASVVDIESGEEGTLDLKGFLKTEMDLDITKMKTKDITFNSPQSAVPESPLNFLERAWLGWAETPSEEKKYLEKEFGKQNVQRKTEGDELSWVVKEDDGIWRDVNPAFAWNMSGLDDIGGDVSQFIGRYGLKTYGAAKGAAIGAALGAAKGAALGAAAGPGGAGAGAVLGVVGGFAGGIAGSMLAETAESGIKAAQESIAPESVGSRYTEDLSKELMSAAWFGGEQVVFGGVAKYGLKGVSKAFAGTVKRLSSTPAGKNFAAGMIKITSGLDETLARAMAENPIKVERYAQMAVKDTVYKTSNIYKNQVRNVDEWMGKVNLKLNELKKQYSVIDSKFKNTQFDITKEVDSFVDDLYKAKFINKDLTIRAGTLKQSLKKGDDRKLLLQTLDDIKKIKKISKVEPTNYFARQERIHKVKYTSGKVSLNEYKDFRESLRVRLYGKSNLEDSQLAGILETHRLELKKSFYATIGKVDKGAAKIRAGLDNKYGPLMRLQKEAARSTDDKKVNTFIKKLIKGNDTYDELIMDRASEFGISSNLDEILMLEAGKLSKSFFGGRSAFGIRSGMFMGGGYFMGGIPGVAAGFFLGGGAVPRLTSMAAAGISSTKQVTKQLASPLVNKMVPYADHGLKWIKSLPPDQLKAFLSDPKMIDNYFRVIGAMGAGEAADKERLLMESGVK